MFDKLFGWLSTWFGAIIDFVVGWIGAILAWVLGLISTVLGGLLDWLISLIPDWLGNGFSEIAGAFGPAAMYFGYLAGLDVVAPTILGAYILKFAVRRLPGFG